MLIDKKVFLMCLISIVIPVYNVEDYLEQCLKSVINQDLNDIEIICVNDGSTDNSLKILKKFASKDKRIRVISKENGGQASARNLGIQEANGKYISFVDSDDFIKEDMFTKLYDVAETNDLDIAMCKVALYDNNSGNINHNAWYYKLGVFENFNRKIFNHEDTREFTCEISVTPYNKIYKTSLLKENNILFPEGLIFEDEKFFYDVYLRANKVSIVDEFLYYYRVNRKGSTVDMSKDNDYSDMVPIYKLIRQTFKETGNYESYKVLLANRLIHLELSRFTQTSERHKEHFFNIMKEDLSEVLKDESIYDNLSLNIKSRVSKLLDSNTYDEFKELDKHKEFSIIIACNNSERFLDETISSIVGQSFSFESNIQLILVDAGSTDGTADICKKYVHLCPENVLYIYQDNINLSNARNEGLKYATGKYINFLEYMDKFKGDTLEHVYAFFQNHPDDLDLVSTPIAFFDQEHSEHPFSPDFSESCVVILNNIVDSPLLFVNSVFFKREILDKNKFNTELFFSEGSLLINQVLLETLSYGFVSEGKYWYRKRNNLFFRDHILSNKDYYLNRFDNYFLNLANQSKGKYGFVRKFIQYLFLFELDYMFKFGNIEIFSNNEINEFYNSIQKILSFIDDKTILSLKNDDLNLKHHLLAIKYGDVSVDNEGNVMCDGLISKFNGNFVGVYCDDVLIDRLDIHKLGLNKFEINEGVLSVSGDLVSFFNNDEISIEALKITEDGATEIFEAGAINDNFEDKSFLGCTLESSHNFKFEIPLDINENTTIKFQVKHKKFNSGCGPYYLNLRIHDNNLQHGFFVCGDYCIKNEDNYFKISSYEEYIKNSFSVVMACYNSEEYLEETIQSLLNQTFSFKNNIQLILVDDGSADGTADICKKYVSLYPNDIIYVYQENQGQGAARNHGLEYVTGKYVNFLDSDDKFREDTFENVFDFFEKHYDEVDLVSVSVDFFDREHGGHPLNYKYWKTQVVDIREKIDYPQLFVNSAFFKRELFNKFKFDTDLVNSEDALIINQILLEKMAYGLVKEGKYWYRRRRDESSTIDNVTFNKEFYLDRLNNYFKKLIDDSLKKYNWVHKFIQYLIVYDLQWMFRVRDIDEILSPMEIRKVYIALKDVLSYVDDDVILKLRDDYLNIRHHMLAIKYGDVHIYDGNIKCEGIYSKFNGDYLGVYAGDCLLDRLDIHKFGMDIVEIKGTNLFISGYLYSFIDNDEISIEAVKLNNDGSNEIFKAKKVYYPNREKKFLGCVTESSYDFDLVIPLNKNENSIIKLQVKYIKDESLDLSYQLDVNFNDYARLSKKSNYSVSGNYILEYVNNDFVVTNYKYPEMIKKEFSILKQVFNSKEPFYTSILAFRIVYLLLYPFYRNKRIWLFMDRRESADDNAEHLFKYASKQKDGIKKYFTVSKESDDFNRLSKIGNVLPFYSIKQRLIYLFAEKIISSHPDEIILNPFMGKNIRLYCSLINSDKIFLQHGVTKDNISSWLRKYDKNLSLLITVSDLENQSFFEEGYNYDENVVQTLGFPRFDNLLEIKENNCTDSKQIIITPSWREELFGKNVDQIRTSEYFIRINSLINNEQLIATAKKLGYTILFKPHPLVYDFIDLFDKNDYVLFDDGTKYQELFKTSDLMITDYSSVAFDFSYMNKPVIYYQYGDDYNFKEGYFDYETMGFGEVIADEDELIKMIIKYMENDCKMKERYKNRVIEFYKYNDKNNCKRVYDAILNIKHL